MFHETYAINFDRIQWDSNYDGYIIVEFLLCDEKQFQDILKASLTTLLLSIPGLTIFLFIEIPASFYWFLYYIFFVLLILNIYLIIFFKSLRWWHTPCY